MKVFKVFIELILTLLTIIIVSCLPLLVQTMHFTEFIGAIISSFRYLFQPDSITIPQNYGGDRTFFEVVGGNYLNTMFVLLSSFFLALTLSLLISFFYIKSHRKRRKRISSLFFLLESIPDVLMVVLLQFFFIFLYKTAGWSFDIVSLNKNDSIYLLPIICLTIIPTLQLFKYFSSYIEDEQKKIYSEFLKAKGLSENYIIIIHLFRNAFFHFINQSKSIILFMLSNLLILELVLNVNGLMLFIKTYGIGDHRILMWSLILIYFPFLLFYKAIEIFSSQRISNWGPSK